MLNYSFLIAFPLFLHFFISLISNCLSLLFGTQGRPRKLKPFLQRAMRDQRGFCTQEGPIGSCSITSSSLLLLLLLTVTYKHPHIFTDAGEAKVIHSYNLGEGYQNISPNILSLSPRDILCVQFSSVQSLSHVQLFAIP